MLRSVAIALAVAASLACAKPASADPTKPLNVRDALGVLTALRGLDAHPVIIKQAGSETTVMMPWNFGNGALRLAIARDIAVLAELERAHEESRVLIIKEILRDKQGATAISPSTPEMDEFTRQYNELLGQPAQGLQGLVRIKAADLKLDANEIPASVLAGLSPILDQ